MHDPKFERDVQERMDGLQFNPSDQVWTRLEQELNKEKRRTLPLFWLLLLVGGMLIGAGSTWFLVGRNGQPLAMQPAATQPVATQSSVYQSATPPTAAAQSSIPSSVVSKPPASSPVARPIASTTTTTAHIMSLHPALSQANLQRNPFLAPAPSEADPRTTTPPASSIEGTRDLRRPAPEKDLTASLTGAGLAILAPGPSGNYSIPQPPIGSSSSPTIANNLLARENHPANERTAKKAIQYRHPAWEAGFTGGAGMSSAKQGILRQPGSTFSDLNLLSAPATAGSYGQAGIPSFISPKAYTGPSFWAGVFVQRPIGSKVSISAGLNLHYYSTRIITGQQVTGNSNYPTPSLFYLSAVTSSSRSYPYYPSGDDYSYVNRYYFLELPLSIQWQFNRSNKLPLFFEGGLSAARMMSVNALYYNESSGVYYKVGTPSSNPLQLFSSASLLAGLHWGNTRIQLGPQFQYGLTSLLKANAGPGEHLMYGGLKLTVVPGWK